MGISKMEKKARTYIEMPGTYNYKGHTYHLGDYCAAAGWRSIETGNEMFRYYYGPNDDRMFLWVDCYLNPIEDLFDYDQFLPKATGQHEACWRVCQLPHNMSGRGLPK